MMVRMIDGKGKTKKKVGKRAIGPGRFLIALRTRTWRLRKQQLSFFRFWLFLSDIETTVWTTIKSALSWPSSFHHTRTSHSFSQLVLPCAVVSASQGDVTTSHSKKMRQRDDGKCTRKERELERRTAWQRETRKQANKEEKQIQNKEQQQQTVEQRRGEWQRWRLTEAMTELENNSDHQREHY